MWMIEKVAGIVGRKSMRRPNEDECMSNRLSYD
jgi:hypothetical protein